MSQAPAPNQPPAPAAPPPPAAPAPVPQPAVEPRPTHVQKFLVVVTAALLLGWFAWLGYTALTKSHEPTVSHAQASAAKVPVVAEVTIEPQVREAKLVRAGGIQGQTAIPLKGPADKPAMVVKVTEQLVPNGPAVGTQIGVVNLPASTGFVGPGEYLLLLDPDEATLDGHPAYFLVGPQRSPGAEFDPFAPATIYKWGPDVRSQVKRLFP